MQMKETEGSFYFRKSNQEVEMLSTSTQIEHALRRKLLSGMTERGRPRRDGAGGIVAGTALDSMVVVCKMHSNVSAEDQCIVVD